MEPMKRVELVVLVEQLQNVRNTYDIVHTLQFRQHLTPYNLDNTLCLGLPGSAGTSAVQLQ